jgi:hypothetical protein
MAWQELIRTVNRIISLLLKNLYMRPLDAKRELVMNVTPAPSRHNEVTVAIR